MDSLPRAVVKVRVPRGPGAVEGERQLLVVLVLLTPHPEGGEHLSLHKAKKEVRIGPRLRQGPTPIHGTGSARACSAGSPACGDPQRRGLATPCPHCKHVAEPKTQGGRRKDSPKANKQEPHGPVSPVVSDPRATRPRPSVSRPARGARLQHRRNPNTPRACRKPPPRFR